MVSSCVELWSSKVFREYSDLALKAKEFIKEKEQRQLKTVIDGTFIVIVTNLVALIISNQAIQGVVFPDIPQYYDDNSIVYSALVQSYYILCFAIV